MGGLVVISRRALLASATAAAGLAGAGLAYWPRLGPYRAVASEQRRPLPVPAGIPDLVRLASLAANGHNAQPWRFLVRPDRVTIAPDVARRTPVVDPDDHHLFVSLGCAAENLALAARAAGRSAAVSFASLPTFGVEVELAPGPSVASALADAIPHRQSTRAPYDGRPVSSADIRMLLDASAEDGVRVEIFTDRTALDAILDFVIAGNDAQMDDPAFVAELRDWIRFTPDDALATRDGLFSASSGNPVVPRWLASRLFGLVFTKSAEADKYADHVRSSAGIAVFVADAEDADHWVRVGRSFQRFALQATVLGIRTAHLNQPVEVASVREPFARWLGEPGRRPDLVVRFGRGPVLPMSLRRAPEAIIDVA